MEAYLMLNVVYIVAERFRASRNPIARLTKVCLDFAFIPFKGRLTYRRVEATDT